MNQDSVKCSECGEVLDVSDDAPREPCPRCGSKSRAISVVLTESIKVSDGLSWVHTREFYKRNRLAQGIVISLSLGSIAAGLIVGPAALVAAAIFTFVAYLLSPVAVIKIREIRHGK